MARAPAGPVQATMAEAIIGDRTATATTGIRTGAVVIGRMAAITIGKDKGAACWANNINSGGIASSRSFFGEAQDKLGPGLTQVQDAALFRGARGSDFAEPMKE